MSHTKEQDNIHSCLNACTYREKCRSVEQQRDDLLADLKESDALRNRLATLLSETAIALKGEEAALQRHSWHDLPVVALAAMIEIEMLKGQRDDLMVACQGLLKAHRVTVARPPKTVDEAESQLDVIRNAVAAAEAAIASVKTDQFRDATKMIDETSDDGACGCTEYEQQHCRAETSPFAEHPKCAKLVSQNAETSAPAIVFYPSGSLGEPVESEGGEA